jgi:ribosomal protein L37AE/L43A
MAPTDGSIPFPKPLDEPARASADAIETAGRDDAMICERCGKAEMYRMHAVWRCPACGFKTDCCGW